MKKSNVLLVIAIIMMVLSWVVVFNRQPKEIEIIKCDTVTTHDTLWKDTVIYEKQLVPKKIVEIKRDTITKDTVLATESKRYDETLTSGVDTCEVSAFVSGIHPSLDSLSMRLKTHHEVKTVEITNYVKKPKTFWDKFHIGLQMGYGLGLKDKEFQPYVGIGGSFDL